MRPEILTPREHEAARLAVEGRTNKEVAEKMGLTAPTVEQYLHRAYSKLGVSNRGELHLSPFTLASVHPPKESL